MAESSKFLSLYMFHKHVTEKQQEEILYFGKKCFTVRAVRHWHGWLREAVDAPAGTVLKTRA